MKTIRKPIMRKLSIALIPIPIILTYIIVTHTWPVWASIIMLGSVALYMILTTYYCIVQKCYGQLALTWFVLVSWVIVYVIQHCYIDKLFDNR
jgi:hypothetical protein